MNNADDSIMPEARPTTQNDEALEQPAPSGILPSQAIEGLIASRAIQLPAPLADAQLQPASLDLRLGGFAYRVRASFLPGPDTLVADKLEQLSLHRIEFGDGAVLETGCVYVVPLLESLDLPADISAATNPKSSTGRLDVFTRVIADRVTAFDQIPAGYKGPLYAEICPQTFPIIVRQGSRLSQIRFRCGNPRDDDRTLQELHAEQKLVSSATADISEGIGLTVDLSGNGPIGYRARRHTGVVDVDKVGACAIAEYWEPITLDGALIKAEEVMGPPRSGISVAYVTDTRPTPAIAKLIENPRSRSIILTSKLPR